MSAIDHLVRPARAAEHAPALLPLLGLALLGVALACDLATLLRSAIVIIGYPYGIDYGEGIVWQQMLNMIAGRGYAPIGVYPAIVFHYPPVYHLAVAAFSTALATDPLATGRVVSLGATLASAVLVGWIALQTLGPIVSRVAARMGGMLAGLIFLSCGPVTEWAPVMRVDMLSCALSLGGLVLALRAPDRPMLAYPAALCFVLAAFTKQVALAAPLAAILGLLIVRRPLGLKLLATCLVLGGAALIAAELATGGGFLRHVVLYNINRTALRRLLQLVDLLRDHLLYVLVAGLGTVATWRRLRGGVAERERLTLLALLLFFAIKTAMLAMIAKSGGSSNYAIEWCAALAIFATIGLAPALAAAFGGERSTVSPTITVGLTVALALQAVPLGQWGDFSADAKARAAELDRLSSAIHHTRGPVISDDMTLLLRAGRPVMWEPAIAAELASVGRYDQAAFLSLVRRRCFAGFITDGDRGRTTFDSRYNPPIAQAMDDLYPRELVIAGLTLHLPPLGVTPAACFPR